MNATKPSRILVAACCVLAVWNCAARAQDEGTAPAPSTTVKLDAAYVTRYVWRGLVLNPDGVIQPSLTISHSSGLSFNWWGSLDTTDVTDQKGNLTEIDYTLNYGRTSGKIGWNVGLIDYTFPNTVFHSTAELYASACFGGLLSPTLSVNYDFDEADGFYAALSAGYGCPLPWKSASALGLSARVGYGSSDYNEFYFLNGKSGLTDLLVSASLPIPVSDKVTATPALYYSTILDGDLKDSVADSSSFFGGVTLSVEF